MYLFDSHCDTPSQIYRLRDVGVDHRHAHVDFPKMRRGGVGAAFFALYTPAEMPVPEAVLYVQRMISGVRQAVRRHSSEVRMARFAAEVIENAENGWISILLGMENGAPIDGSLALLRWYSLLSLRRS